MNSRSFSYARQPAPPPRNAKAISDALAAGDLSPGDTIIVSFVGQTSLVEPHVFVDGGQRYDWSFAASLQACIVVRPGVDSRRALADIYRLTQPYPTLIDFDRQLVGSLVDGADGTLKLWPRRRGSEPWRAIFE